MSEAFNEETPGEQYQIHKLKLYFSEALEVVLGDCCDDYLLERDENLFLNLFHSKLNLS